MKGRASIRLSALLLINARTKNRFFGLYTDRRREIDAEFIYYELLSRSRRRLSEDWWLADADPRLNSRAINAVVFARDIYTDIL